jgi:hypothetical protein
MELTAFVFPTQLPRYQPTPVMMLTLSEDESLARAVVALL